MQKAVRQQASRLSIDAEASPSLRPLQFPDAHAALGRSIAQLLRSPIFARRPFGEIAALVAGQVNRRHYFLAARGETIVGYVGWALVSMDDAEAWLTENRLPARETGHAGAVCVVNLWQGAGQADNLEMLRLLTRICSRQTHIYARRFYADGRVRPVRLKLRPGPPAAADRS